MKRPGFLAKLRKGGKASMVEPSDNICDSYVEKAENCLKSARILLQNGLFENSVTMSYFAMYNSLTAFLFKAGIKCENHSGSILLLKRLSGREDLFKAISSAKKERIDKQYYVDSKKGVVLTGRSAKDMLSKAEDFLVKMKLLIGNLSLDDIENMRERFKAAS